MLWPWMVNVFTWSGALLISIGIVANIFIIWPIFEVKGILFIIWLSLALNLEQDKNYDLESSGNEVGKKETSNL